VNDRAVRLVDVPDPALSAAFATLWTAVSRTGGAVGFLPDEPAELITSAAVEVIAGVAEGREEMLVACDGDALAGTVFLRRGEAPRKDHTATVVRLMVDPARQGAGWGRTLLDAAVGRGRELGLEHLLLAARGGTTLPAFYRRLGWTEVGVFPGVLRLDGDRRDEHWFQLMLRAGPDAPARD